MRSDDLNLVERFQGLKLCQVASLPLLEKSCWVRHYLDQFLVPAEAEVSSRPAAMVIFG